MKRYMSLAERRADRESHERDLQRPDRFSPLRHMFAADVPCSQPVMHKARISVIKIDGDTRAVVQCSCGYRSKPAAVRSFRWTIDKDVAAAIDAGEVHVAGKADHAALHVPEGIKR